MSFEELRQQKERERRNREVKAAEQSAKAAADMARTQKKVAKEQARANRDRNNQRDSNSNGETRFHGLYCLLIGWWLAMFLVCLIIPLFSNGGRKLIKKSFGIW